MAMYIRKNAKNALLQQNIETAPKDPSLGTLRYLCARAFSSTEEFMKYIKLIGDFDNRFSLFFQLWKKMPPSHSVARGGKVNQYSLDTLARKAGLDAMEVKAELVRYCHTINVDAAAIISDIAHPYIVKRNAKEALKPSGVKDRELHFWRRGELPGKGGVSVNVNAQATALAAAKAETTPLPDFEEGTISASKIVRDAGVVDSER